MIKNGWTHPAQLTNGGVFSSTSPAKRARRAAYGLVAVCFQLYSGGRGAELFRWQWRHTSVVLAGGAKIPVWALGLSGILPLFQKAPGAGFWMQVGNWDGELYSCLLHESPLHSLYDG
jgi:hypothetical protein